MRKQGFTLVELLVVVAIIALLLAILLPALNKARDLAKAVVCKSTVRSLGLTMSVYAADYAGWLPPVAASHEWNYSNWTQFLRGDVQKRTSPSGGVAYNHPTEVYASGGREAFHCVGRVEPRPGSRLDYGMNWHLANFGYTERPAVGTFRDAWGNTYTQFNTHHAQAPSQLYLLGDTRDNDAGWHRLWNGANSITDDPNPNSTTFGYRHLDEANVSFHDGHVESVRRETTPSWTYAGRSSGSALPWYNHLEHSNLYPYVP